MSETGKLLFPNGETDWDESTLERIYDAIEDIATKDLGLEIYQNQFEIVTAEQMLDAHASIGLPLMYGHWSFGKHFSSAERAYQKGAMPLAYEMVINSDPCKSYNIETSSIVVQTMVMAHAAFGHNHFFRNNYLFKQWTDATGILGYLEFAQRFIKRCEERHGEDEVESLLDAAHALMDHAVFHQRPRRITYKEELARWESRYADWEKEFNPELEATAGSGRRARPGRRPSADTTVRGRMRVTIPKDTFPQENLLYFLEKHGPFLEEWQREILRIVRNIAQYFYPQPYAKVMNEGFATFVHCHIMNKLYDCGQIPESAMLEFAHIHSGVIFQPDFDDPRFRSFRELNPYKLGLEMFEDIRRVCTDPTEEDKEWFKGKDFVGCGDWRNVLRQAVAQYRDESFILQFLSPRLMRKLQLIMLLDEEDEDAYLVESISDEHGFKRMREELAKSHDISLIKPHIRVVEYDEGRRIVTLVHKVRNKVPLAPKEAKRVAVHFQSLWGFAVKLVSRDEDKGEETIVARVDPNGNLIDDDLSDDED